MNFRWAFSNCITISYFFKFISQGPVDIQKLNPIARIYILLQRKYDGGTHGTPTHYTYFSAEKN